VQGIDNRHAFCF
jgi:drug/metabolite transporter (DMT)-like permease